ncbi:MAG: (Fe-S)-binding protein [Thermodesulfobacteriota bacterium]
MDIAACYDDISQCNKCGFCQVACPIFRSTGHESGVARGRLALLRAIIEGRLEWGPDIEEPLFDCLLCGACTANCFPAIPTADLVLRARSEYLDRVGRKSIHRLLFDHLLPYPQRLHWAARAVALGKNSGLSDVAQALGLLRIFGRNLPKANEIVERFPNRAFRDKNKPGVYKGWGESMRVGYFVGCGVDVISQKAGNATLGLLKKTAKEVHILDNGCCGLPAWSYGDMGAAQRLAERNVDIVVARDLDVIVTDCSSCASFLKKYATIFPEGHRLHDMTVLLVDRVSDMVTLLFENQPLPAAENHPLTVTYHDPCHAARGQGLVREPREILKRLPGIDYRELPEADWCCGGAGSYAVAHHDLSRRVLDRKMDNLKKTGADILVTSCPACVIQLSFGVRRHGLNTRVCHISELV